MLGDETTRAILEDWRSAAIDARLRATLAFLEKMTLSPDALDARDAEAARAAGVSDEALRDAIYVCAVFNVIDRIADALEFHVPSPAAFRRMGAMLLRFGYD